jgi:hypothetical protein
MTLSDLVRRGARLPFWERCCSQPPKWGEIIKRRLTVIAALVTLFSAPEVGRDHKARWRKPRDHTDDPFSRAPLGATSANRPSISSDLKACERCRPSRASLLSRGTKAWGGRTQAIRFHRFAVGKAGLGQASLCSETTSQSARGVAHAKNRPLGHIFLRCNEFRWSTEQSEGSSRKGVRAIGHCSVVVG